MVTSSHIEVTSSNIELTLVATSVGCYFWLQFWEQLSACRNECYHHGSHVHLFSWWAVCNCSMQRTSRKKIALDQYVSVWTRFCPSWWAVLVGPACSRKSQGWKHQFSLWLLSRAEHWHEERHRDCCPRSMTLLWSLLSIRSGKGLLCREVWHGYKLV